jgi:hypothetical protein
MISALKTLEEKGATKLFQDNGATLEHIDSAVREFGVVCQKFMKV